MTRDKLEAAAWRLAPALCGDNPARAMDILLRCADAYAQREAGRILAERELFLAAAMFPPDDPGLTAERRRVLEEALPPDPRTMRRSEAVHGKPEEEAA
jgi:hypothetical protein